MIISYTTRNARNFLIICGLSMYSCSGKAGPENHQATGRELALMHCGSCHLSPEPGILDKKTWTDHILPAMAPALGVGVFGQKDYYPNPAAAKTRPVSMEEWAELVRYFKEGAPAVLKRVPEPARLNDDWSIFKLRLPAAGKGIAGTTFCGFDSLNGQIETADAATLSFDKWSRSLKKTSSLSTKSPVVNAVWERDKKGSDLILTSIGRLFAFDIPDGTVAAYDATNQLKKPVMVADHLFRPVQTLLLDVNKDGLQDYVVLGFGHQQGSLNLYTKQKNGSLVKSIIRNIPGAEQAISGDFNGDGWTDLMVLFAQADEGIWMFLNDHHGGFKTRNILRFPPVFGSTSFQLVDFNHDGKPDILYTCGDNGDISQVLKPFHGVYIFENTGNWKFKQKWFYPVNGCMKAVAADFKNTGLQGVVSAAYYYDLKHLPKEAVMYFEQTAPMNFVPHAIPVNHYGRFLTLSVADIDKDGDQDVIIGNFGLPFLAGKDSSTRNYHYPFLVLENQTNP